MACREWLPRRSQLFLCFLSETALRFGIFLCGAEKWMQGDFSIQCVICPHQFIRVRCGVFWNSTSRLWNTAIVETNHGVFILWTSMNTKNQSRQVPTWFTITSFQLTLILADLWGSGEWEWRGRKSKKGWENVYIIQASKSWPEGTSAGSKGSRMRRKSWEDEPTPHLNILPKIFKALLKSHIYWWILDLKITAPEWPKC